MYNHGHKDEDLRIHYYDAGISFAQSHTRLHGSATAVTVRVTYARAVCAACSPLTRVSTSQ